MDGLAEFVRRRLRYESTGREEEERHCFYYGSEYFVPALERILKSEGSNRHTCEGPPDERTNHRNESVTPVGCALPGNRKNGVRDARPEIAGGIDGVPGRSAQRESDGPDEKAHKIWSKARRIASANDGLGEDRACDKYQNESSDDLADGIAGGIANRRTGGIAGQLQSGLGRFPPMWKILQP